MTGPGGRSGGIRRAGSPVTGPGGRSGSAPTTGRIGRRLGAAAALLVALLVAGPAAPALASPPMIKQPAADAVLDTATATVTGNAEVDAALGLPIGSTLENVTLTIGDTSIAATGCADQRSCAFTGTFTLTLNGPYTVTVVAKPKGLLSGEASRATRDFAVAAPPAKPVVDPPKVTDGRTVELSWSRNVEEDMLYYAIFRKDPGETKYLQVSGKIGQTRIGTKPSFVDTSTSSFGGGDYGYQVVAVRKGPTGTDKTEAKSAASGSVSATVPVPATTSSTTAATLPGGAPAGRPTTTGKPAPPAGIDLSGFLSSRSQPIALPAITVPEPPDTGFAGTLPFGARPAGGDLEEGDAQAKPPGGGSSSVVSIDAGRPLVPVAGGLILLLLALHMRLLGRRVKAPLTGDLPLDLDLATEPEPAPGPTPTAKPEREPEPEPEPRIYDIGADEAWDDDWAPAPQVAKPAAAVDPPAVDVELPGPEPVSEPEPDLAALWAPPPPEPDTPTVDPDEIEVFEVVSSSRRRLARAGSR